MTPIQRETELIGLIIMTIREYLDDNKIRMSKVQLLGILVLCMDKIKAIK